MLECTFEDIGDNFHIAMRVIGEAAAARDAIIVHHAQSAKLFVFRVVIVRERKGKAGVEPAVVGVAAVVALANGNHRRPPGRVAYIVVDTTIVNTAIRCRARRFGRCSQNWSSQHAPNPYTRLHLHAFRPPIRPFPRSSPLVYSVTEEEHALSSEVWRWIPHRPQRKRERLRAPPWPAKR